MGATKCLLPLLDLRQSTAESLKAGFPDIWEDNGFLCKHVGVDVASVALLNRSHFLGLSPAPCTMMFKEPEFCVASIPLSTKLGGK